MERRFCEAQRAVKVENRADGQPMIVGYAAVFYDGTPATEYVLWDDSMGRAVERILPGAFDGALSRPDDVRGLFNHDANEVLGRTKSGTMKLSVDDFGLRYEIQAAETDCAKEVTALIQRGDISGSSFSFSVMPQGQTWTINTGGDGATNEVRELKVLQLFDVGPVTFPAYGATTAGVRSVDGIAEARAARDAWVKSARPAPTPNLDLCWIELAERGI